MKAIMALRVSRLQPKVDAQCFVGQSDLIYEAFELFVCSMHAGLQVQCNPAQDKTPVLRQGAPSQAVSNASYDCARLVALDSIVSAAEEHAHASSGSLASQSQTTGASNTTTNIDSENNTAARAAAEKPAPLQGAWAVRNKPAAATLDLNKQQALAARLSGSHTQQHQQPQQQSHIITGTTQKTARRVSPQPAGRLTVASLFAAAATSKQSQARPVQASQSASATPSTCAAPISWPSLNSSITSSQSQPAPDLDPKQNRTAWDSSKQTNLSSTSDPTTNTAQVASGIESSSAAVLPQKTNAWAPRAAQHSQAATAQGPA